MWTEVNPLGSYPRNDPNQSEFTCDIFPEGASIGQQFVFRVIGYNIQGQVISSVSDIMFLASVPDKPSKAPESDPEVTFGSLIKVDYWVIPGDGGLPILSYELQMGSLTFNDFETIVGRETNTL